MIPMEKQYTSKLLISGNEIELTGSLIEDGLGEGEVYLFIVHLIIKKTGNNIELEVSMKPPDGYITVPTQSERIILPGISVDSPKVHCVWRIRKVAPLNNEIEKNDYSPFSINFELVFRTADSKKTEIVIFK